MINWLMGPGLPWVLFHLFVFAMLAADLGIFHKNAHEVHFKEALRWSAVWISLAGLFAVGIYFWRGGILATEFVTGYLVEKSLSVDNIFVFLLIFNSFKIPGRYQHRVLFWGILGALVMRGIFIYAGISLIERFQWITYLFGGFLVFTGIKIALPKKGEEDPKKSIVVKWIKRILPISDGIEGQQFWIRQGKWIAATPLLVTLILVEVSDVIFALDSIPAVIAVSRDPFVVYTSNIFAILGLRSLYFAVAGLTQYFHYIHYGLAVILVFVGVKMMATQWVHMSSVASLGVILGVLAISIGASIRYPGRLN